MNDIIHKLGERYKTTSPDVATTVERSLIQLSSGIYTEEERFIFELLQNAVDSFEEIDKTLNIGIRVVGKHLVFMHNGAEFTARDIEGLCDVGNGNKTGDVKKIGYKGIGFKSVFMRSACVTVQTGQTVFKFDKAYWDGYWETHWDEKKHGVYDKEKSYLMPWQIIPLKTQVPLALDTKGYNVVTYIEVADTSAIEKKVSRLLQDCQFLLFLRCRNIRMTYYKDDSLIMSIRKETNGDKVSLYVNDNVKSCWLLHNNEAVNVPERIRPAIAADINTPEKLKKASTFELSFAIAIDDMGKMRRLTDEESVVYTYLPTSFRFGQKGFPFLVNANFITDAGRQQLHKDSEWNKLIFSAIPREYLGWMVRLSSSYDNYYDVLPEMSYGSSNELEEEYARAMTQAVGSIAFIPRLSNKTSKLLAKDAIMDSMRISDAISKDILIKHVNTTGNHHFCANDFIAPIRKGKRLLADYGVYIFDQKGLKALFERKDAFAGISVENDIRLADFLFRYYMENHKEQDELIVTLGETPFLLDEHDKLQRPTDLFFPSSYKEQTELAEDAHILHPELVSHLIQDKAMYAWLKKLGVQELDAVSFIKTVICKSGYVTQDNAIDVTRYLFEIYQKINFFDEIDGSSLSRIKFISKKGTFKNADELYLGSIYKPTTDIEPVYDGDIYVSEGYPMEGDNLTEWAIFFCKFGVYDHLGLQCVTLKDTQGHTLLDRIKSKFEELYNVGSWGTHFNYCFSSFEILYAPFILTTSCSLGFAKKIWSAILGTEYVKSLFGDHVEGSAGFWSASRSFSALGEDDFLPWALSHIQELPSTDGSMQLSTQLFANTENILTLAGKYLPVIDVDCEIHESWTDLLHLRNQLEFDDYLTLLTNISTDEQNAQENKERISLIYQRIVELGVLSSEDKKQKIREWAGANKILSQDSQYVSPGNLSYVTVDGFGSANRVYVGKPSDKTKVLELLALMGVKIITEKNLTTDFQSPQESDDLKRILKEKVSPLAIVSFGDSKEIEKNAYDDEVRNLKKLLDKTRFFHCDGISLSYGDNSDVVKKSTFGRKNEFYYTGNLRPANVEPLLTPLCAYLGIKNKERELFMMFIEDFDGVRQNLMDKGYDVSLMEKPKTVESGTIQTTLGYTPDENQQHRNVITGFKGEIIVFEKLKAMGYEPECLSISTREDYEHEVEVNGETYYCKNNYANYDISFVTKNGITVYVEVKATTCDKTLQQNMPISYNELSQIETYNSSEDKAYLIVRVFGIDKKHQDIYILKGHLLEK